MQVHLDGPSALRVFAVRFVVISVESHTNEWELRMKRVELPTIRNYRPGDEEAYEAVGFVERRTDIWYRKQL